VPVKVAGKAATTTIGVALSKQNRDKPEVMFLPHSSSPIEDTYTERSCSGSTRL